MSLLWDRYENWGFTADWRNLSLDSAPLDGYLRFTLKKAPRHVPTFPVQSRAVRFASVLPRR